jgi:hypothetical protein
MQLVQVVYKPYTHVKPLYAPRLATKVKVAVRRTHAMPVNFILGKTRLCMVANCTTVRDAREPNKTDLVIDTVKQVPDEPRLQVDYNHVDLLSRDS